MQFLSTTIFTTLIIFALFLPSFAFLRIIWGESRGKIHVDNIYRYFIWGLPISIILYAFVFFSGSKDHENLGKEIWNLVADDQHKINNAGYFNNYRVDTIRTAYTVVRQQVYTTSPHLKQVDDTSHIISTNLWHTGDTTNTVSVETKHTGIKPSTKKTLDRTDTFSTGDKDTLEGKIEIPGQYVKKRSNIYESIWPLFWQYLHWLIYMPLFAIGLRILIYASLLDYFKPFRIDSDLDNLLSGRQFIIAHPSCNVIRNVITRPIVLVDVLCEIGEKMKIYRGIVKKFRARDECLEYLVLTKVERGDLLNEPTGNPIATELSSPIDLGFLGDENDFILPIKFDANGLTNLLKILDRKTVSNGDKRKLQWFEIKGDYMYFSADQIKNINVIYSTSDDWPAAERNDKDGSIIQ